MTIRNRDIAIDAEIDGSKVRGAQQTHHGRTFYVVHPDDPKLAEFVRSKPRGRTFSSIQTAVNGSRRGDLIYVLPGPDNADGEATGYDETVTIPRTIEAITIIGLGGRGSAFIEPQTAGAEGMDVRARDITLVNFGVAGNATGDFGIRIFGERFRAVGCKFEGPNAPGAAAIVGPGTVAQINAGTHGDAGDSIFEDCEFAWSGTGLRLQSSNFGACTQVKLYRCLFHNCTAADLGENDAGVIGSVRDLWVQSCMFARQEDGTAPTDYIDVDSVGSTGFFGGNFIANPTNAAAVIQIAAGVIWGPNGTEAGYSTARPV